jgi:transcriptional regulator with XRE-family HTH domain
MDDVTVGRAIRSVRVRKGLRQADVARRAGIAQQTISRLEAGSLSTTSLKTIRRATGALGVRVTLDLRWQGADLDRLIGARHSAMHEALAELFDQLPGLVHPPEVSFSVYGERGVIDILAWHAASRSLLVIEIKTELADLQETIGTLDRKVRLAAGVARERGWNPATVSAWLVVADGSTNRRRVEAHRSMLRAALPMGGPELRSWLRQPKGTVRALTFLRAAGDRAEFAQVHRVRRRSTRAVRAR